MRKIIFALFLKKKIRIFRKGSPKVENSFGSVILVKKYNCFFSISKIFRLRREKDQISGSAF